MVLQLDKWLVAFIIFICIVFGGTLLITDLSTNYNTNMNNSEFDEIIAAKINDSMFNMSEDMTDKTLGEDIEDDGVLESIFKGAYLALKQVRDTFDIFWTVGGILVAKTELGIHPFFFAAAWAVAIISVIIALIYIFTRLNV